MTILTMLHALFGGAVFALLWLVLRIASRRLAAWAGAIAVEPELTIGKRLALVAESAAVLMVGNMVFIASIGSLPMLRVPIMALCAAILGWRASRVVGYLPMGRAIAFGSMAGAFAGWVFPFLASHSGESVARIGVGTVVAMGIALALQIPGAERVRARIGALIGPPDELLRPREVSIGGGRAS